jgi:hypothetical protein
VPGDEKRDGPPTTERPPQQVPPGTALSLPHPGDARRVGEVVAAWLDVRMGEVDALVAEARSRVEAIPDLRTLWLLAGEILVRLAAVEHELAELRKARR